MSYIFSFIFLKLNSAINYYYFLIINISLGQSYINVDLIYFILIKILKLIFNFFINIKINFSVLILTFISVTMIHTYNIYVYCKPSHFVDFFDCCGFYGQNIRYSKTLAHSKIKIISNYLRILSLSSEMDAEQRQLMIYRFSRSDGFKLDIEHPASHPFLSSLCFQELDKLNVKVGLQMSSNNFNNFNLISEDNIFKTGKHQ